ncbi:MAG: hypothetical protein DIU70_012245 [Bacillota bacterium]|nr:MAG: hypothetical protein DIU70_09280 [Bacillota bacterium]
MLPDEWMSVTAPAGFDPGGVPGTADVAGLPPWAAGWAGLAAGFALLAAGLPLSSLALFGLLAGLAAASGTPWWAAGALAGAATAAGHGITYAAFARLGLSFLSAVARWMPALAGQVEKLGHLLGRPGSWPLLFLLRWVGLGYTQVFWLLGATRGGRPALLVFLLLNDLLWALVWAYGAVALVAALPTIRDWLTRGALALLAGSTLAGGWQVFRARRQSGRAG